MKQITEQLKLYKMLTGLLTASVVVLVVLNIFLINRSLSKEITAERINIVESNGKVRMVLSNRGLQHPGIVGGNIVPPRDRPAGLVFFNDEGDECGGLMYTGDTIGADMVFSVDQYENDQLMQLQYNQTNMGGKPVKNYGLKLWDRNDDFTLANLITYTDSLKMLNNQTSYERGIANLTQQGRLGTERMFVGKNKAEEVGLFLQDSQGRPRIRIFINKQNEPIIQILDGKGEVIN
ncbi:MAG: hypothetical protein ABIN80_13520 [Dyadobacter sp.]|uniref:hypothetical protein n=1 Tax=Dyadobacter sp. TaxID=1914288 RepID=UPI0032649548